MSKLAKSKRNFRNSKAWKDFRHKMNVKQHGLDPVTLAKLAKGCNLHHRHISADEDDYKDMSDEDDFVMLNILTHKMLHWGYTYYKKYGKEFLERLEEEWKRWY